MPIGRPSAIKSLLQSSIPMLSAIFAGPSTETFLSGAGATLGAIRGLGWSPNVEIEARCAARCVRSGREFVTIDAGANVGAWSKAFRQNIAGKGRIYAFEPQPEAAAAIRTMNLDGCQVLEKALGERSGKRVFYTSGSNDSMASLYERDDTFIKSRKYYSTEVEVTTLDEFVEERRIETIDFMKMDLEGAELDALKGATECMRSGLLQAFSFEFGISDVNSRVFFRDLFRFITDRQYKVSRITPAGRLIRVSDYSEDQECFARTSTYLAQYLAVAAG